MTLEEIEKILSSTSNSDWVEDEELGVYTYRQDVLLRIQKHPVDGCRAFLPMPTFGTKEIPYRDHLFAKIVAPDRLDEYINRSD